MKRLALTVSFCMFAVSSQAAPQLLASFHKEGSLFGNGYEALPVSFELVDIYSGHSVGFSGFYLEADIGKLLTADTKTREGMAALLTHPAAYISAFTGNVFPYYEPVNSMWQVSLWTTYVPQLGPGLAGYTITDITQTIDNVYHFTGPGSPGVAGGQTVRIFGVVPEPSYILLVVAALAALAFHRARLC